MHIPLKLRQRYTLSAYQTQGFAPEPHYLNDEALEQKKKRAINEGGLILTLEKSAAGNTVDNLSDSKDTEVSEQNNAPAENSSEETAAEPASTIQGTGMTEADIIASAEEFIASSDLPIDIVGMKVIGSRMAGTAREDSDLDVLVEYSGDMKEDSVFNELNGEPLVINGVKVDFFPIRKEESGDMQSWLDSHKNGMPEAKEETPVQEPTAEQPEEASSDTPAEEPAAQPEALTESEIKEKNEWEQDKKIAETSYKTSLETQRPVARVEKPYARFNIFDFIEKNKKSVREALKGVFHKGGQGVASNSRVLVAVKADYDKKLEGKITDKDGNNVSGVFPNWKELGAGQQRVQESLNLKDVYNYIQGLKADEQYARLHKNGLLGVVIQLKDGEYVRFSTKDLELFCLAANKVGGKLTSLRANKKYGMRMLEVRNGKDMAILMCRAMNVQGYGVETVSYVPAQQAGQAYAEQMIRQAVRDRAAAWAEKSGVEVEVLENADGITNPTILNAIENESATAWYVNGTVYLYVPNFVKENIPAEDVDKTFIHEIVSHKGLKELLGEERFNELMDSVWDDVMTEADRKTYLEYVSYLKADEQTMRRAAADEYVAKLSESINPDTASAWEKIVAKVKEMLMKMGLISNISKEDLSSLLIASYNNLVKNNEKAKAEQSKAGQTKKQSIKTAEASGKPAAAKKIDDAGEKIAGARKDMLRDLAKTIENVSIQALVSNTFSKVFKKPNFRKLAETGAIREKDAVWGEAICQALISSKKPLAGTQEDRREKRRTGVSSVERWAQNTYEAISTLNQFLQMTDEERDAFIDEIEKDPYVGKKDTDIRTASVREWNSDESLIVPYTPNPIYVAAKVLEGINYSVNGAPAFIPLIKGSINAYEARNPRDGKYIKRYPANLDETLDSLTTDVKLSMGIDTDIPADRIKAYPTGIVDTDEIDSYEVLYMRNHLVQTRAFPTKEEAQAFVDEKKKHGVESTLVERKKRRRTDYRLFVYDDINGERVELPSLQFDTAEEADAYLQEHYDEVASQLNAKNAEMKHRVGNGAAVEHIYVTYVYGTQSGYGIVCDDPVIKRMSGGINDWITLKVFPTRSEAQTYLNEHKEELLKPIEDIKEKERNFVFFEGERPYKAKDWRKGRDVTSQEFIDKFGFRGVQFGNWTNDKDRQMALNRAYDSFMNLADLLGWDPKALSLNGELGIAFGARGSGSALAHYELSEVVINLTKTRGAGALAHEWIHALDNYFSRRSGDKVGMISRNYGALRESLRPEVYNALRELMSAMRNSAYARRSRARGTYWGSEWELLARLFGEYVNDKLTERGENDSFLSRGIDEDRNERARQLAYLLYKHRNLALTDKEGNPVPVKSYEEWLATEKDTLGSFPYPTKQETAALTPALEEFLKSIKLEKGEDGNVVLFQKAYHGSAADFTEFDLSHIGEGEGNQAYGYGVYVTTNEVTGRRYADVAVGAKNEAEGRNDVNGAEYVGENAFGLDEGAPKLAAQFVSQFGLEGARRHMREVEEISGGELTTRLQEDTMYLLDISEEDDFSENFKAQRRLYVVDIPDDNGDNYLHWDGPLTKKQADRLVKYMDDHYGEQLEETYGKDYKREIQQCLGFGTEGRWVEGGLNYLLGNEMDYLTGIDMGAERNATVLRNAGFTGMQIRVDRFRQRYEGDNYVIYNPKDVKIEETVRFQKKGKRHYASPMNISDKDEYGSFIHAATQKNTLYDNVPFENFVFTANNCYLYNTVGEDIFPVKSWDIELNRDEIRRLTRKIDSLYNRTAGRSLDSIIGGVIREERNVSSDSSADGKVKGENSVPDNVHLSQRTDRARNNPRGSAAGEGRRVEEDDIRFSKANQNQLGFVSNAAKALDAVKMEKATPAQWKAMIAKEGGLKAGEDKWLGLSQWLDASDRKTITKDEVRDFINQNAIIIEEEEYGELELSELQQEFDQIYDEIIDGVGEDEDDVVMSPAEKAWEELRDRHSGGDDFDMAFSLDNKLEIQVDNEDAAGYFLGLKPINSTRLDYTTDGLENKREIALTVPTIDSWNENDDIHFGDAGDGRAIAWVRFGDAGVYTDADIQRELGKIGDFASWRKIDGSNFVSKHDLYIPKDADSGKAFGGSTFVADLGERGYLLSVNDKGKGIYPTAEEAVEAYKKLRAEKLKTKQNSERNNVLVIDEIQSKRHQEGREQGYKNEVFKVHQPMEPFNPDKLSKLKEDGYHWSAEYDGQHFEISNSLDEFDAREYIIKDIKGYINTWNKNLEEYGAIPSAPFEKNWHELAIKRMLRLAAEEGYDKLAWTNGDMQARRYNIGTVVNEISGGLSVDGERIAMIHFKDTGILTVTVDDQGKILNMHGDNEDYFSQAENLSDIIGKDKAVGILSVQEPGTKNLKVYKGEELVVGGEGMKGFYDKMLTAFVDKYCKKWGVKVKDMTLPGLENEEGWHSVDVTPEMKESVMNEGQVMFSKRIDKAPKETKKGYAAFVVLKDKDGVWQLYPKMISGEGTPVKVWLDADTGTIAEDADGNIRRNSLGRISVQSASIGKNGGRSKGTLAWRPGKHLAEYPNASQFELGDGTMQDNIIFFEVEYAADKDYQTEAWEYGFNDKGVYKHTQAGLPYIPKDGYYKYRTNADPTVPSMIITGSYRVVKALTDEQAKAINQKAGGKWLERSSGQPVTEETLKSMGLDEKSLEKRAETQDLSKIEPKRDESARVMGLEGYTPHAINFDDKNLQAAAAENGQNIEDYRKDYKSPEERGWRRSDYTGGVRFSKQSLGPEYTQFKGDAKGAIAYLKSKKNGQAIAALYHDSVGYIDLPWGEEGTGRSDGFGLAKLVKYHPDVVEHLQEILSNMEEVSRSSNRVNLEDKKYKAGIRLDWNNEKKTWLLTLFEKKNSVLDNTTDTDKTIAGKRNDTATPQDTVSEGKDTELSDNSKFDREGDKNPYRRNPALYSDSLSARQLAASETARVLGAEVQFVTRGQMPKGHELSKGVWADGKVLICLENNRNEDDAVRTVLHECVGHMGLRRLLGEKNVNDFCMELYRKLPAHRRAIIDLAREKKGWSIARATEEYLASLAETYNTDADYNRSLWDT